MKNDSLPSGLVSVVIPTFNQANFLREALDSLTQQTHKEWEALVVNNFSTDNTIDVVNSYGDQRMRIINFSNDGIIARSRNLGISLAQGIAVAFLDSDDLWEKQKLERSFDLLNAGFDLVCHAERWFGSGMPDRVVRYGPQERASYESLLFRGNCISTSATTVRRSVLETLGGFRDNKAFVTTEDYDLWLRIAKAGYAIGFCDEVLGSFRRHSSSASSATLNHLRAEISVIDDHLQSSQASGKWRRSQRVSIAYYSAGRSFTRSGSIWKGVRMFAAAIGLNPISWRPWVGFAVHLIIAPTVRLRSSKNEP